MKNYNYARNDRTDYILRLFISFEFRNLTSVFEANERVVISGRKKGLHLLPSVYPELYCKYYYFLNKTTLM